MNKDQALNIIRELIKDRNIEALSEFGRRNPFFMSAYADVLGAEIKALTARMELIAHVLTFALSTNGQKSKEKED
jgi:hypothetical protein